MSRDWEKGTKHADYSDPDRAFDPKTGRNFAWDKDKQAWIDTKTGECICPKCPPPAGETIKKVLQSVNIGIGIGGGGGEHRHGDRVRGEDRTRTADKIKTDKAHTTQKQTTTTHKTVTVTCKCHPCTCSPCACH